MGQALRRQRPTVVPRSRYTLVRALLAVSVILVVGLSVAVAILAYNGNEVGSTSAARPLEPIRYGNFNPLTGRPDSISEASEVGTSQYRLGRRQP
jgi:hypothetical protein